MRRLPEPTVLEWVRRMWDAVPSVAADLDEEAAYQAVSDLLVEELGTYVYGLSELFREGGPPPQTMEELRTLAKTRLHDTEQCNGDEHSLRVLANGLTLLP